MNDVSHGTYGPQLQQPSRAGLKIARVNWYVCLSSDGWMEVVVGEEGFGFGPHPPFDNPQIESIESSKADKRQGRQMPCACRAERTNTTGSPRSSLLRDRYNRCGVTGMGDTRGHGRDLDCRAEGSADGLIRLIR